MAVLISLKGFHWIPHNVVIKNSQKTRVRRENSQFDKEQLFIPISKLFKN